MHTNLLGAAIALLLTLFSHSIPSTEVTISETDLVLQDTYLFLQTAYQKNQEIIVVDVEGNQYKNPSLATLKEAGASLFSENRVRITLVNNSADNRCSTELALYNADGGMIGNYSLNTCSSFGWIFFTNSKCFDIDVYHDAGQEAPFGSAISGSVDWTFTFNDKKQVSGTYFDGGDANMITVASPCYQNNTLTFLARDRERKKTKLPFYKEKG